MVVLHATDPASVFLEARARMADSSPETIERELYDEPTVLRMLAMRRTLFLVPLDDVPIVHAAGSGDVARRERPRTLQILADGGSVPYPADHFAELEEIALAAIRERGEVATTELRAIDPRLAERVTLARGKAYQGSMAVARASFITSRWTGASGADARGVVDQRPVPLEPDRALVAGGHPVDADRRARAELVRRWLRAFGPGTRDDINWWTGWTVPDAGALEAAGAVEVSLDDGAVGYVLPDDLESTAPVEPWVALLPALDATTMGWTVATGIWARIGRAVRPQWQCGPTIWVDGRTVGGWAQRASGEIALGLLEDVGAETARRSRPRPPAWRPGSARHASAPASRRPSNSA